MVCQYCNERPVRDGWAITCAECTFECAKCKQDTPYELGVSRDMYCDPCGVALAAVSR